MQLIACIPPDTRFGPMIWENIQDRLEFLLLTATGRDPESLKKDEKDDVALYVVIERENLNRLIFFMFQLRHSKHQNIFTHSPRESLEKSSRECKIDCDENSDTNARTQVRFQML